MTKEEIIHRLQYARHRIDNATYAPDVLKAIDIAIEAVGNTDSDTISRQAAIEALDKEYRCTDRSDDWDGLKTAMLIIENLPSVQPERKTAKWNFIGYNMFECTCCGTAYTTQQLNGLRNYNTDPYAPKFCPNCGADMRGEDK